MAYDEELADRVREMLADEAGLTEKAMFGGGRPMKGWILVAPEGFSTDDDLAHWVREGVALARTLPPKRM